MDMISEIGRSIKSFPNRKEELAAYYQNNRKRILARNRVHYALNRKKRSEYWKQRYKTHKAQIDARNKTYRDAHPERITSLSMAWQKAHPDKVARYKHKWYLKNQEREKKRHKKYSKNHPEVYVIASQRRRALKQRAESNLENIKCWITSVKNTPIVSCYYCQSRVSSKSIHFDHIIPLSKGGSHSVENLCVSCAPCNLSKHDKYIGAWIRIGQQVLEL